MCLFTLQAEWKHEPSSLPPGWPTEGRIDIRGFGLRYRHDLDLAIRNITININGGEKVWLCCCGIVCAVYVCYICVDVCVCTVCL